MDERARLTLSDILLTLFALAALRALYPVFDEVLADASLAPGTQTLMVTILPLAILVLLGTIYLKAGAGAGK